MSNLDEYITTIGCDIIKFNEHVKHLIEQLNARGGETQDLLTNLFKAYVSVKDARFVDYVNEKLSQYEEGEPMEADQLMTWTANKYKNMIIQYQWEAPSPHDATIQALESKVEKLQRELKRAPKQQQQKNPHTQEEGGPKYETTTSQMVDQQRETAKGTTFLYQSVEWEQMVLVFQGNWRKM